MPQPPAKQAQTGKIHGSITEQGLIPSRARREMSGVSNKEDVQRLCEKMQFNPNDLAELKL